ncbi:HGGxSTG domain-containing protein [Roseovarius litoreus]|uniref:HGGxSTG domain-containing protein n=1 Tax=Roseovarius litoreus TaxID=1155722 RepID=UPI00294B6888|nr:HGGxSTG domain-containing protein [Roseovarius litoreus]
MEGLRKMLTNVEVEMDFKQKIARYKQAVDEIREKCPGVRVARLCPATAHLSARGQMACFECNKRGCLRFHELGLDDYGEPLAEALRPGCGAKTNAGEACQARVVPGKRRCRMHGGLSTGPKTEKGRERIRQAQKRRWKG